MVRLGLAFFLAIASFVSVRLEGNEFDSLEERWESIVESLELRDDQIEPARAAFVAFHEERRAIFERHGIERGNGKRENFKKMRKAAPQLKSARRTLDATLSEILDDSQMQAYRKHLQQTKKKVGEAIRNVRKESTDTD